MKYLAELLGTFALVFCGTGAIIVNAQSQGALGHVGIAFAFGTIVMIMVYVLGSLSGAHINPAVTIAAVIARKFPVAQSIPYIVSQIAGALLASLLLQSMFPADSQLGITLPAGDPWQSFAFEMIFTFFLMIVILSVVSQASLTSASGLAIGATILVGALVAGPISGGSFNPARSLGPAIVTGNMAMLWIYLLAPVIGASAAALIWPFFEKQRD
jgi:MIP family channel proteins